MVEEEGVIVIVVEAIVREEEWEGGGGGVKDCSLLRPWAMARMVVRPEL